MNSLSLARPKVKARTLWVKPRPSSYKYLPRECIEHLKGLHKQYLEIREIQYQQYLKEQNRVGWGYGAYPTREIETEAGYITQVMDSDSDVEIIEVGTSGGRVGEASAEGFEHENSRVGSSGSGKSDD